MVYPVCCKSTELQMGQTLYSGAIRAFFFVSGTPPGGKSPSDMSETKEQYGRFFLEEKG
jgi:hypothetical protein